MRACGRVRAPAPIDGQRGHVTNCTPERRPLMTVPSAQLEQTPEIPETVEAPAPARLDRRGDEIIAAGADGLPRLAVPPGQLTQRASRIDRSCRVCDQP